MKLPKWLRRNSGSEVELTCEKCGATPDKFAVKRTSKEWEALVPKKYKLRIIDPDGWDRSGDFDYSFNKEKITKNEFDRRLSVSTISVNVVFFTEDWETGEKIC